MKPTTPKASSWGIIFRADARPLNADGNPQAGMVLHGIRTARPQNGWLVFEDLTGAVVYTVPSEVVAYAGDMQFDAASNAINKAAVALRGALHTLKPQGEA